MLTHRPLTPEEARTLQAELKTTPNIIGYTARELVRFSDAFVAEREGEFAGVCISKDLRFGWTDIAILYVLPAFRGNGIGAELCTAAWKRAEERERHIFTLSRNPAVIHLMERFGMETSGGMRNAPLAAHLHMNRHMMNLYRWKEMIRKSSAMRNAPPLRCGVKRYSAQGKG